MLSDASSIRIADSPSPLRTALRGVTIRRLLLVSVDQTTLDSKMAPVVPEPDEGRGGPGEPNRLHGGRPHELDLRHCHAVVLLDLCQGTSRVPHRDRGTGVEQGYCQRLKSAWRRRSWFAPDDPDSDGHSLMTQPAMHTAPSVSVIIAAFANERWTDLVEAVESVLVQSHPAQETIVVIDHNPDLFSRARSELRSGVRVLKNALDQGASGARNTGVAASTSEVVVFLDDDATADPQWLENLITPFEQSEVIGVGGRLEPAWTTQRPRWFAPEFDWVVGASYRGMPEQVTPIRNVWSGNMAIRREVFDAIGGFRLSFGKTGNRSRPEDTDLCLRAGAVREGTHWVFQPTALVHHKVPASREHFRFFLRRCFAEGQGKADLGALVDRTSAMSSEKSYARTVLPKGVAIGLGEAFRGEPMGATRAGVIILGLAAASAGMVTGRFRQLRARSQKSATAGPPAGLTSGSMADPSLSLLPDSEDRPKGADAHSR